MITQKAQAKISLAVRDYETMFPEEYGALVLAVQDQRDNLQDDMATVKGSNIIKRALSTIDEKLYAMIHAKLDEVEMQDWSSVDSQRWFCKQFPQFSVIKNV